MSMSLGQLADTIGASVAGDGSVEVAGCAPIDEAGPTDVTFVANAKYTRYLRETRAAAVIIETKGDRPEGPAYLLAENPYFAFRAAMVALHGFRKHPELTEASAGISPRATIHPEAVVGEGTVVHPNAVVDSGARIGSGCILYPGVYVGTDAVVGEECVFFPNAVVYDRCVLGDRVTLHANTVIGQDGFGYATCDGAHHKIPPAGIVVIEDDVEMGAGCAVERATMGETRVGRGTKFADLVCVGHGTRIGSHCLFVSLVGVSGSVDVGNWVVLGGQAGVAGHLSIGDGVLAGGKAGITETIAAGQKVGGNPAVEIGRHRRNSVVGRDLCVLAERVRKLEKLLAARDPKDRTEHSS